MGLFPKIPLLTIAALGAMFPAAAQTANNAPRIDNAPRILRAISNVDTVTLAGNRRPETRPRTSPDTRPDSQTDQDAGTVAPDLTMRGMMLELSRTPAQDAALAALMAQQLDPASPNYHHWLTPDEFGAQFGPAQADIDAITAWLASQGLTVDNVARGRMVIQFSGPAASVSAAFHTEIHRYLGTTTAPDGTTIPAEHYANAADPQIPSALAPVIAGVSHLHNYLPQPLHVAGRFSRDKTTGEVTKLEPKPQPGASGDSPSASIPGSPTPDSVQGANGKPGTFYPLGPADFGVEYNVQPLWKEGIDGTGQSIAIVGVCVPPIEDIEEFRALFGLAPKDPVLTAIDQNTAGANANPYCDAYSPESDLDLEYAGAIAPNAQILYFGSFINEEISALYIVDNDAAPIMSESFGTGEVQMGNSGNLFYYDLWQQAAAEGISAFVAAGDSGTALADYRQEGYQYAQNGLAVSGYASSPFNVSVGGLDFDDEENWTPYWNTVPDPATQQSMISYIPEIPWNESCASVSQAECNAATPSREYNLIYDYTGQGLWILGGSGGASNCATQDANGNCLAGVPQPTWQTGVGVPTSGQPGAGVRLQPDVSLFASSGMNRSFIVMCSSLLQQGDPSNYQPGFSLDPGCSLADNRYDFTAVGGTSFASPAMAGIMALLEQKNGGPQGNPNPVLYSMAAAQNPSQCNSTTGPASTCVFNDITKGNNSQPCVANSPDCSSTDPSVIGVLSGWSANVGYDMATGLGSLNAYNLVHQWTGSPVSSVPTKSTNTTLSVSPSTAVHGTPVQFSVSVTPQSGSGTPTGIVTGPISSDISISFPGAPYPLTSLANGAATISLDDIPGGAQTVTFTYLGDSTYKSSTSNSASFSITPENSTTVLTGEFIGDAYGNPTPAASLGSVPYGTSFGINTQTAGVSGVGTPTGSLNITQDGAPDGQVSLNPDGSASVVVQPPALGTHTYTTMYTGDNSFNPGPGPSFTATVVQAPSTVYFYFPYPEDPNNVVVNAPFQIFVYAPGTGTIQLFDGGTLLAPPQLEFGEFVFNPSFTLTGVHNLSFVYSGDANYLPSTTPFTLTVKLAPVIIWNPPPIHYGDTVTMAEYQISAKDINGNPLAGSITGFIYVNYQYQFMEVPGFQLGATWAPNDSNYATIPITANMPVLPAAAIIQWPPPAAIQYGTLLTGTQLDATAGGVFGESLTGTFVYSPAAGILLPAGADPLAAQFTPTGNSNYAPTLGSTSLTVTQATPSVSLSSSATNVGTGVFVSLNAVVSSLASTPTGRVEFLDGTNDIGIVPVNTGGAASLTTLFSTVATHPITALYLGDSNFTASTSPVVGVVAVTPGYTISSDPPALSIRQGGPGNATLTLTPEGNFSGTVSFTCSNLPAFASCQFSPSTVTFAGNNAVETTQLTILTTAVASADTHKTTTLIAVLLLLPPFFWPGLLARNRRRRWLSRVLMLLLLAVGAVGISSCGGGGAPVTPPGMDTIQIQATVNGSSGSSTTTLNQTLLLSVTITQ